jgi:hypothetical protein
MQKCSCIKAEFYTDTQGTSLCMVCSNEEDKTHPMAVPKDEVIAMLKKLGDEYKLPSWNRTSAVLIEAMNTMNSMYAYGVNKFEPVIKDLVPFNLEAALYGYEVRTRDGRKVTNVRIASKDNKSMYDHEPKPIQGIRATLHNSVKAEEYSFYHDGGAHLYLGETGADLFMVK